MFNPRESALDKSVADAINEHGVPNWTLILICEAMIVMYDDDRDPVRITDWEEMNDFIDQFESGESDIESIQIQRNFNPLKSLIQSYSDLLLKNLPA